MDLRLIVIAAGGIFLLVIFFTVASFISVWLKARFSGAPVSFGNLIAMRWLRKLPHSLIVDARIRAVKSGIDVGVNDIETHFMAGGDVIQTMQGLINAQKAGISLDWDQACTIDLATKGTEKSVIEAVRTSINPKVIDCPSQGGPPHYDRWGCEGWDPGESQGPRHRQVESGALCGKCAGRNHHCSCGRRHRDHHRFC